MLPTFIIIGAPRCGTDSLFYNIGKHPAVSIAKEREVHFFDRNFSRGISWYSSFFSPSPDQSVVGEKTANYLVNERAPKNIKEVVPNIKLIAVFRNPIERAYSHYWNWIRLRKLDESLGFRQCCREYPQILDMGFYYRHMSRYLALFEREQFLWLFFDDLLHDPGNFFRTAFEFLQVSTDFVPPACATPLNSSGIPQVSMTSRMKKYLHPSLGILRRLVPKILTDSLGRETLTDYPPMSAADRLELVDLYRSDMLRLFELTGKKLPKWLV